MATRLNKFGEIIDDGNCPSCHEPLKEEWVACPYCGAQLDVAASRRPTGHESPGRSSQRDISSRRTIAPVMLPELESWARSNGGLNFPRGAAADWAQDRLPFFEEHDFALFKELQSWARSNGGLNFPRGAAADWAFQALSQAEAGANIEEIKRYAK